MGKYFKTGAATGTLSTSSAITLMGYSLATGRELWLTQAWFYHNATTATTDGKLGDSIAICDATVGITSISAAKVYVNIEYGVQSTIVNFPPPGLRFVTNCVAMPVGCTAITAAGGSGYEIG